MVRRGESMTTDMGFSGRQDLTYSIIDCDTFEYLQEGIIPLLKRNQLQWIGFTEDQVQS